MATETVTIHPDIPARVSLDYLRRIDAEPAGRYLAQPKYDGWRRLIHVDAGKISVQAKNGNERREMPPDMLAIIQSHLGDHDGATFDCEWVGPRADCNGNMPAHMLYVFDLLRWKGVLLRPCPFKMRIEVMRQRNIPVVTTVENPHMMDLFQTQLTIPTSEGVVVREAASGLLLSSVTCKVNPSWAKIKFDGR